jgi:hypothetical protein
MTHTFARFDDSPVVPPPLNGQRIESWKDRWRRLTSAGVTIDRDHYMIGREIDGRWIGIVK